MESSYTAVIVHSRYVVYQYNVEVNASALPLVWSRLFGPPNFQNLFQQNSSPVPCPPMLYNR